MCPINSVLARGNRRYNANQIISEASYSYDQYKIWHPICESTAGVTACVSINCVCFKEFPLYLGFEEEKVMYNLVIVISW